MTLGNLKATLRIAPRRASVYIESPFAWCTPSQLSSYRGYYEQLAIEPVIAPAAMTVAAFLGMLEQATDRTFTGYKGGDYVMNDHTEMWVSEYGYASGMRLYAVHLDGESVRLEMRSE